MKPSRFIRRPRCRSCRRQRFVHLFVVKPDGLFCSERCAEEFLLEKERPATEKTCRHCLESWPLTGEFWHRDGDSYSPECRACRLERRRELAGGAPRARSWSLSGIRRQGVL